MNVFENPKRMLGVDISESLRTDFFEMLRLARDIRYQLKGQGTLVNEYLRCLIFCGIDVVSSGKAQDGIKLLDLFTVGFMDGFCDSLFKPDWDTKRHTYEFFLDDWFAGFVTE